MMMNPLKKSDCTLKNIIIPYKVTKSLEMTTPPTPLKKTINLFFFLLGDFLFSPVLFLFVLVLVLSLTGY